MYSPLSYAGADILQKYWACAHILLASRNISDAVISPPRGRFSHMAMFRLGSFLFIPAYLTVILYRVFANASGNGNLFLMAGKSPSMSFQYSKSHGLLFSALCEHVSAFILTDCCLAAY